MVSALSLGLVAFGCTQNYTVDGDIIENQIITANNLRRDFTDPEFLQSVLDEVNCADSALLGKKIVLAGNYHSKDTTEILLIPFSPKGENYRSSAYSDIANRFILINPTYIKEFTLKNTLNDTASYRPVLQLMLLHEVGHFILHKAGSFDAVSAINSHGLGEQLDETQPEFLTSEKKVEMSADSLAIEMVKQRLRSGSDKCLDIAFSIERIVPGMQFMLAGTRIINDFGKPNKGYLRDPSNDHPNLELRITFMNYFLFPGDSLKQVIDDYLYARTIEPVHRQEFSPHIFQGNVKELKPK